MPMDARARIRWCLSRGRRLRAWILLALAGAWLACGRNGLGEVGETDCAGGKACAGGSICSAGECIVPCSGALTFSGLPLRWQGQAAAVGQPLAVDIDGDGIDELLVPGHDALSFYGTLGIAALSAPEHTYSTGTPFALAAGDLNGDGRIDLVVAHDDIPLQAKVVDVLINEGNGYSLGSQYAFPFPYGIHTSAGGDVALGDVDGDGELDLVTASASGGINVQLGAGDGTFGSAAQYSSGADLGSPTSSVTLRDFDGDGKLDVAAVQASSPDVSVLINDGNGSFEPAVVYSIGSVTRSLASGDLDGDGEGAARHRQSRVRRPDRIPDDDGGWHRRSRSGRLRR
jgi:hypothetical protein